MRSPEEYNDDLSAVKAELEARGLPFDFHRHLGADPKVKDLVGYYPTGEWQITLDANGGAVNGK